MVTITQQPETDSLLSAYTPIIVKCNDASEPAIVYCDVYFNQKYIRTYFSTKKVGGAYVFDIQDAVQEQFTYNLPELGGKKVVINPSALGKVMVKLRNSITVQGITKSEQTEPVLATNESASIAGGGVSSNSFFVLNAVIQHEESKSITEVMNSYKSGLWDAGSYPLTKRPKTVGMGLNQSSYFPMITPKSIAKIKLFAKFKGESNFREYEKTLSMGSPGGETPGDIEEISHPPIGEIKWKQGVNENINDRNHDLKYGAFPSIAIKPYPEDPDNDIVSVVLFESKDGAGYTLKETLGTATEFAISGLTKGVYQYKIVVTDSKANTAESNVLKYTVVDTTPAPGTITLEDDETIFVAGGIYRSKPVLDPGGEETFYTNCSIDIFNAVSDFYTAKGMDVSNLRIKFSFLAGFDSWSYNNTLVTDSNHTATEVKPNQINFFDGTSLVQGIGAVFIIHQFTIYHTADPSKIFTNYLQMGFS